MRNYFSWLRRFTSVLVFVEIAIVSTVTSRQLTPSLFFISFMVGSNITNGENSSTEWWWKEGVPLVFFPLGWRSSIQLARVKHVKAFLDLFYFWTNRNEVIFYIWALGLVSSKKMRSQESRNPTTSIDVLLFIGFFPTFFFFSFLFLFSPRCRLFPDYYSHYLVKYWNEKEVR